MQDRNWIVPTSEPRQEVVDTPGRGCAALIRLIAPRLNLICKPNDWAKAVKQSAAGNAVSQVRLHQQSFVERAREYGEAHAECIKSWRKTGPRHYYDIGTGFPQAHLALTVNSTKRRVAVEVYINDNKELYAKLHAQWEEIEIRLAMQLDWQQLPGKKASRIFVSKAATSWTRRSHKSSLPGW